MKIKKMAGSMMCLAFCLFFCLTQVGCSVGKGSDPFWSQPVSWWKGDGGKVNTFVSNVRAPRGNPEAHYLLACYYQERGMHREAIQEFGKVAAIDPSHAKAYNGLGISYSELKDYQKAESAYLTALELNPKLGCAYNNLGYTFFLQGNMDAAIDAFTRAAALDGTSTRVRNNLGMAYLLKGDALNARKQFEISGGDAWAAYNMARLYYKNGMFSEARQQYGRALEMNPALEEAQKGLEASSTLLKLSEALSDKPVQAASQGISTTTRPAEAWEIILRDPGVVKAASSLPAGVEQAKAADASSWLQNVEIEVSNGNGVRHMAKDVGNYLKKKGFKVVRLTNAKKFTYSKGSIIYSRECFAAAVALAGEFPQTTDLKAVDVRQKGSMKIRVLVGKDLIPYSRMFKNVRS